MRSAARYALGRDSSLRRHEVWPDDIFLVSFPKSGNTWTRFLLGNLMNPDKPVGFDDIESVVPDIAVFPRADFRKLKPPRLIKSHDCFDPRYRRVIYIIRDPRDVAVSLYYYAKKVKNIDDSFTLEAFITRMLVPGRSYNGTWGEHAGSWLVNASNIAEFTMHQNGAPPRSTPGATGHGREFLLVRYEDLLQDAHAGLHRIAEFLRLEASSERIEQAVARSSADSMRKLESAQNLQWQTTRETRKDIPFVRQAKSGQWRTALSAKSIAEIESAWGHLMRLTGYELAAHELASST
ncbi:MAG: sulfotransferase domain-containing protein [Terriglobales bacterium]